MNPWRFTKYSALILFCVFALAATAHGNSRWVTLKDCRYLPNPANDGDSFHVRVGKKE